MSNNLRNIRYVIIVSIILIGIILLAVVDRRTVFSIEWMNTFQAENIPSHSWQQIIASLGELRTGIPPILAIFDMLILKLFGYQIATGIYALCYDITVIIIYIIPIFLFSRTIVQQLIGFVFAVIFLHGTILIHPTNPAIYDILYPLFILAFIWSLKKVSKNHDHPVSLARYSVLAGLFLSITELLRPFFLIIMIVVIFLTFLQYQKLSRRYFLYFLLPILILSGGWHLKLLLFNDGQITWTNISGYNIQRAWEYVVEWPELPDDAQAIMVYDRNTDRYVPAYLNTSTYYEGSQQLQKAFFTYVIQNPIDAANWGIYLVKELLTPKTQMFQGEGPTALEMNLYRLAVNIMVLIFITNLMNMFQHFLRNPMAEANRLETILIVITTGTILFLAIGDRGEEARFILSILPMWVALPTIIIHPALQ